ncbi:MULTISPECIES: helix-turn-helix domain-containing protein [Enterococcus]|uniref:helix-turn-helix domain-containing protein n=1 Tax=Enterococcus TaxID=1350 RepID=UPI00065E697F|nr:MULTISPECIES: helix-turn-helix domain-containing protein [Enterococcus]
MAEKFSFGGVIREIRKERQLSQKMLSQDICSQSVLSRIENNEELPNVLVMQQLCERLNVTIDQVMLFHRYDIQKSQQILEQMEYHFFHNEYEKLEELLEQTHVLNQLYLDTDLQLYYYYEGSCKFYLHQDYNGALLSLKQGLSYTFQVNKIHMSANEIQLLSCIGRVYSALGDTAQAQTHLEKSMTLYGGLPAQRRNNRLTKIFFNYGSFLLEQKDYQQALTFVSQGIELAHAKKSYYYLGELFQLKAQLLEASQNREAAAQYFTRYRQMEEINKI